MSTIRERNKKTIAYHVGDYFKNGGWPRLFHVKIFLEWQSCHYPIVRTISSHHKGWRVGSGLFEGRISNGFVFEWSGFCYSYSPNHSKSGRFCPDFKWFLTKWQPFVQILNGFWQNGSYLSGFQIVGLLDFRSHSKSRPFATQPLLDHSKSRLGQISDPHCIQLTIELTLLSMELLK